MKIHCHLLSISGDIATHTMATVTPAADNSVYPEALALMAKKCLEEEGTDNTNNFEYGVSPAWLEKWKKFTGQVKPFVPGAINLPGPVEQGPLGDQEFINGKLWRHLIYWYGLHPTHELDRKPKKHYTSQVKFSVGILSPIGDLVQRKIKSFTNDETLGYVECQVRQILGVPAHRETRLWVKQEGDENGYQMLTDRFQDLTTYLKDQCAIDVYNQEKQKFLSLEICNPHGDWPTGFVTPTKGKLDLMYGDITISGQFKTVKHDDSTCGNKQHALQEMQGYLDAEIKTYKKLTETFNVKEKQLVKELNMVIDEQKKLEARQKELQELESKLSDRETCLLKKMEHFKKEKQDYEDELQHVIQLNTITQEKITLNVGGKYFTTSLQTLTAIKDTYFASMFGGRYPLEKSLDGSYFIDRDGTCFYYVLEYLRNGELDIKSMIEDGKTGLLKCLLLEADYYNLRDLCNDIRVELHIDYADLFDVFSNLYACYDDLYDEM